MAGLPLSLLQAVALGHLHSDFTPMDLPDLLSGAPLGSQMEWPLFRSHPDSSLWQH